MRHTTIALALGLALSSISFNAAADNTNAQIAELKAQLEAMQAKIAELEERADAQSEVNIDTSTQMTDMKNATPKVETKGGLKVTSADSKFEFGLGGRLHFDAYSFDKDLAATTDTTEFRRARLTLTGKAFDWEYKVEQDFAAGTNLEGLRDLYIAKNMLGGKVTIGHFKPYRSMEELTSSNEILMMERPFSSATGLYSGRQFQQGIGYLRAGDNYTLAFTGFNLRGAASPRTEGLGASGRFTFTPINSDDTLHFGVSASTENANVGSANLVASANYAGRRGPAQTIATTLGGATGESVTTYGVEAAGSFGPLFFQAEYVNATFEQAGNLDQDIATWYVQGSWFLNGGHKAYKPATGVFGGPKVAEVGLWELTARYDTIENKDIINREASSWILGMNYYVNPNLRFMLNYTMGENKTNNDETDQLAIRAQFAF
jgi:phosphate-selective porin OprO and OprP